MSAGRILLLLLVVFSFLRLVCYFWRARPRYIMDQKFYFLHVLRTVIEISEFFTLQRAALRQWHMYFPILALWP
jgi:surface polysaccharide O-acyltransferase-like enzyme